MNDVSPLRPWRPEYPAGKDAGVVLLNDELSTYISDRQPGITVTDHVIESPAFFWTDRNHVYVRLNWSQWCTVSNSYPNHIAAICEARYCRVTSSLENDIRDFGAPVYHVAELPREIFASEEEREAEIAEKRDAEVYARCVQKAFEILKTVGMGTDVFPNVKLNGDCVAVAISEEKFAVLIDVLPEDREFTFCSRTGTNQHNPMNRWKSEVVSLDFVDKLRRISDDLERNEEDSVAKIGLVANMKTLENLRALAGKEDIDGLCLFTYDTLAEDIGEMFRRHLLP